MWGDASELELSVWLYLIPRTVELRNIYNAQIFLHGAMHLQNLAAATTAWSFLQGSSTPKIIGQDLSNIKYAGIGREFQDGTRKEIVNNVRFMNKIQCSML